MDLNAAETVPEVGQENLPQQENSVTVKTTTNQSSNGGEADAANDQLPSTKNEQSTDPDVEMTDKISNGAALPGEGVSAETKPSEGDGEEKTLSKNEMKRQKRTEQRKERRLQRRREAKIRKRGLERERILKAMEAGEYVPKPQERLATKHRLTAAMAPDSGALKIAIDCSFVHLMSQKELSKLAQQFGRAYGSNRSCPKPAHFWLLGLAENGDLTNMLRHHCYGFDDYKVTKRTEPLLEVFQPSEIIYLSPDAEKDLEASMLDGSKVMVLGGLVDENPLHKVTLEKADQNNLCTARLPLAQYIEMRDNRSAILPINLVISVILDVSTGDDWETAVKKNFPRRFLRETEPEGGTKKEVSEPGEAVEIATNEGKDNQNDETEASDNQLVKLNESTSDVSNQNVKDNETDSNVVIVE